MVSAFGRLVAEIRHVGSTSVPGLSAKPIVDALVGLDDAHDLNDAVVPLQSLGYEYVPEYERGQLAMPFRRFFRRRVPDAFNVHLVHRASNFWQRHLSFSQHLRDHPEVAHGYEQLKLRLAPQFEDVNEYAQAKTEFVEGVLRVLDLRPAIRQIRPEDALVLRDLRLAALTDSPTAFSQPFEEAVAWPDSAWRERAARFARGDEEVTYFAEDNAEACGMAGGYEDPSDPTACMLVALWVRPEHRRKHVGAMLVDAVLTWARVSGRRSVNLWVMDSNHGAQAFYHQAGFTPTEIVQPLALNPLLQERHYRLQLG